MQLLEYKINYISYRPYLSKLDIKFNNVYQVELIDFVVGYYNNNNKNNRNK